MTLAQCMLEMPAAETSVGSSEQADRLLESFFHIMARPSAEEQEKIASVIGLSGNRVAEWFAERRMSCGRLIRAQAVDIWPRTWEAQTSAEGDVHHAKRCGLIEVFTHAHPPFEGKPCVALLHSPVSRTLRTWRAPGSYMGKPGLARLLRLS